MKLDKIAVASGNKDKIAEIKAIFKGVEIISMEELGFTGDIEETGKTFKENAKIKAETIARLYNIPALSDDSGLCVDALGARRAFIPHAFRARATPPTEGFC